MRPQQRGVAARPIESRPCRRLAHFEAQRGDLAASRRTAAAAFCGRGSQGCGAWRHRRGVACDAHRREHDRTRPERTRCAAASAQPRPPSGRGKSLTETDPGLLDDLNALVEPDARGDPMSSLRWTCKSLRRLAAELNKLGHQISHTVVGELLKAQKFSLQANRKTREGADNPDRGRAIPRHQRRGQGGDD